MRKFALFCGLILSVVAMSAQNNPAPYPQNDPGMRYPNDPNRRGDANYPAYNERNYSNNRWSDTIPAGTTVPIRTDQGIAEHDRATGRVYTGRVAEDVRGDSGNVLIPRGATAELIVQNAGEHDMIVDLESISFGGRRYMVNAEAYDRSRHEAVGANRRTGEFVGGGAALGTILGAIAGGGKGAAIGALAGGAAGAGAQTLTRGSAINIPPETVLTFRLDQPLQLGAGRWSRDNGYDRDGNHYHDNYYHRDEDPNRPPQR